MERKSGILMPMSSLPSPYGIGTMGKSAYAFVDFLKAAGQKYWQVLPLGPTSFGDSPYSSFSSFAGNPYFIDLDLLIKDRLLRPSEVQGRDWGDQPDRIDYAKIFENRFPVLRLAFQRGRERYASQIADFRRENAAWLENYALYMAVKAGFGMVSLNGYWRANTDEIGTMTAATLDPVIGPYMVNYTYPVNIGSSHTEGLEANIMFRPTGFFNVRLNASVFNYGYSYDGLDTNKVSWSARLNVWAKVWNKLELFANARYSSPRLGLYSLSNANKSVDFGVSSDFFNRQLSVNLTVNDIFGWAEWGSNTTAPQYQTTGSQRWNTRFVSFGLTWRIGKMELESKARQGATDNVGTPQM